MTTAPPIRKGVILAAGHGTRLLPATKVVPKEVLPLVDKPIIHYVVQEAIDSGIEQIIMVTSAGKRAVEDYFDRHPTLERALSDKGDVDRLEEIVGITKMADIVFVRQKEQRGIGHAVLTARAAIGDEPFLLMLGDHLYRSTSDVSCARQLVEAYQRSGTSVVGLRRTP